MLNDLRHAWRTLIQARGWTAVVVSSLALGIGANAALFSWTNSLLLQPIPVRDPDSLVRFRWAGPNEMATDTSDYGFTARTPDGRRVTTTFSYPMFRRFLADNRTMTEMLAGAPIGTVVLSESGRAEIATAYIATGNYFQMLGVTANPGRVFTPKDDEPGAPPVGVISHAFWQARFGGAAEAIGKVVTVNTVAVTIVGVASPQFIGIQQAVRQSPDITLPLALDGLITPGPSPSRLDRPTSWWLQVMGRLRPGATPAQVKGQLGEVFRQTAKAGLGSYLESLPAAERATSVNANRTEVPELLVEPGAWGIYDASAADARAVAVLSAVVGLVLLLVCANVANLLLSRATSRRQEISVRLSLGATRGRIVRQLLAESVLLASLGGALGALVGAWGRRLLPLPPGQTVSLDWRVLGFIALVTAVACLLFGFVPALRATSVNLHGALRQAGRGVVATRTLMGRSLLVVQVGISVVLLIGASLFLRTVQNLRDVDVGFDPRNLVLFRLVPQLNGYDDARSAALYRDLLDRLGTLPGVRGAGASQPPLLSGGVNSTNLFVQGRTYAPDHRDSINRLIVTPGFLDLMGIPVVLGRGFTDRDTRAAPRVVAINEAAARKYFASEQPLGQRIGTSMETSGQMEIVGVLRDAKYSSVREEAPPTMYVPHLQVPMARPGFVVRTAGDPQSAVGAIRAAVRSLDAGLPLQGVSTQMEQIELRIAQERLFAGAYALFGAIALIVASVGLFGLMSYSVARRTNEIGIRMALGARPADVLSQVMGESLGLVGLGVLLGIGAALAAGRLVASLLFGVQPSDPAATGAAVAVLLLVAAAAGYLPARRAARVDPVVALREE